MVDRGMSIKEQSAILSKFRNNEINLLVATKVSVEAAKDRNKARCFMFMKRSGRGRRKDESREYARYPFEITPKAFRLSLLLPPSCYSGCPRGH